MYVVISTFVRGAAVLLFVREVYSGAWRNANGVSLRMDAGHIDGRGGVSEIGVFMLLYYLLLVLLGAQVILDVLEKFSFYGSWDIVLQHTAVSVLCFGAAYVLLVPGLIGWPLFAVHSALREFRHRWGQQLAQLGHTWTDRLLVEMESGVPQQASREALGAIRDLRDDVRHMSTWPIDARAGFLFVASHAVPALSFVVPKVVAWFGAPPV